MSKVLVGLSGGVDSAVAALLLKQQGLKVVGVFMQNWEVDNDDPFCSAEQDLLDAKKISDQLDIPFETVNFSHEYWNNVFQHCLDEFANGRTPNPDILCNREIKFKALLNYALKTGAESLATGHYAGICKQNGEYQLKKGFDLNKDQSYFLYTLNQKTLSRALFPLAQMTKPQIREIAKQAKLHNYAKKDSMGICFIGKRNFTRFLQEFLLPKPGNIIDLAGNLLGKHQGLSFYTLGQRKGLGIGGKKHADEEAWYVIDKRIKENLLVVAQGHDHPSLYASTLLGTQLHWISKTKPNATFFCQAKTRYRQNDQDCKLTPLTQGNFQVEFLTHQRAITPGQAIVFYQQDLCLGGGLIKTAQPF